MVGSVGKGQSKCGETNIQISADRGVHIILQKKKKREMSIFIIRQCFKYIYLQLKEFMGKKKKSNIKRLTIKPPLQNSHLIQTKN